MVTGAEEGVGAARALGALKDLPLWLLTALAVSADVLIVIPAIASALPAGFRPWLVLAAVVFNILAVTRAVAVLVKKVPLWEISADARRRFHITAVPQQSFWSSAKQPDDSIVTQVVIRLLVKNRTDNALVLVRVRLIKPKIRGEIVHEDVSVRAVDQNVYGDAVHSGYTVPPKMLLPASASILVRGVLRRELGSQVKVTIGVTDDEGHEQKVVAQMRVIPSPGTVSPPPIEMVSSISNPIDRKVPRFCRQSWRAMATAVAWSVGLEASIW